MQLAAMSRAKYYKKIVALIKIYFLLLTYSMEIRGKSNCGTGSTLCVRNQIVKAR